MSVVQRCPNCGTTQAMGGECEACHETQVRYFCTNHEPGIWLDGPSCARCEARPTPPPPVLPEKRARTRELRASSPPRVTLERVTPERVIPERVIPEREPVAVGGWLLRLVLRFALVVVVLVVAAALALYVVIRSF